MAKKIYMVYLCDVLGCVPRNAMVTINIRLQSFFGQIVAAQKTSFQSAMVHWLAYQPTPEPHEPLLYFVPDRTLSGANEAGGPLGSSGDGFTWWLDSVGAVSEVYTSMNNDGEMLALVGFHELMHNKLRLTTRSCTPKAALPVDPVSGGAPSAGNVRDMAAALPRAAPQWAQGVSKTAHGRMDPLNRYYKI